MRKSDGTFPRLQELRRLFPQFNCCLYANPETKSSFIRALLPSKAREILGVMHMKFFVFDDTVMITGYNAFFLHLVYVCRANLGDSYFTNRMDRYLLIENCPSLANYFETLFYVSSALNDPIEASLSFRDASQLIRKPRISESSTTITADTSRLIGPSAKEAELTRHTDSSSLPLSSVLMSAYLNITEDLTRQLKEVLGESRLDVITSSIRAHGFYKAKGLAGIIPNLYEALKCNFLKSVDHRPKLQVDDSGNERILEYNRPGWSFHGKGITLFYHDQVMMQFGSSNLGNLRSKYCFLITLLNRLSIIAPGH